MFFTELRARTSNAHVTCLLVIALNNFLIGFLTIFSQLSLKNGQYHEYKSAENGLKTLVKKVQKNFDLTGLHITNDDSYHFLEFLQTQIIDQFVKSRHR